jgi:hypothetical protein
MAATDPYPALRRHRYGRLVQPLTDEPSFILRHMFGCLACYVHGRTTFLLAARRPPWRGVILMTERVHHASLLAELPDLAPHPVLSKWLILREDAGDFEETAATLVALAQANDPRLGVEPKPRRRRKAKDGTPPRGRAKTKPSARGGRRPRAAR